MDIYALLQNRLKESGAVCRIISAGRIPLLESEYNMVAQDHSLIDRQFHEKYIQHAIDFSVSDKFPSVRSLIIVATPSRQVDLKFNIGGSSVLLRIPPIYSDKTEVTERIKGITFRLFEANGFKTFPVVLPKKPIAVHSGLAKYGRNNLTYVEGMGSYHRLTLFATDMPCERDTWQDIQVLDRCSRCKACQKNCPTKAISDKGTVIQAERCLAYFNEQPGKFPEWIDPAWHNCIIGCLKCQSICPENKNYRSSLFYQDEFSEEETSMVLKGVSYELLPEKLQAKITRLCLKYCYEHLSRNITAVVRNRPK